MSLFDLFMAGIGFFLFVVGVFGGCLLFALPFIVEEHSWKIIPFTTFGSTVGGYMLVRFGVGIMDDYL